MSKGASFLLEIGCEEIPDRMLEGARTDLSRAVHAALETHRLLGAGAEENMETFSTPRRLAVLVTGLPEKQPDETVEVTGPPISAAYAADGSPQPAATGFARSQGVGVDELYRVQGAKGEVLAARRVTRGQPTAEVLAQIVPPAALSLSFPKSMKWGEGELEYVRPIRWVVALLGGEVVPLSIGGVAAGRTTHPRRGAGLDALELHQPAEYEASLLAAQVMVDVARRRQVVADATARAAAEGGARLVEDAELAEIVCNLVEWPGCFAGTFPEEFLELPAEVLSTTLRHHQHCFSLADESGNPRAGFVAVVNIAEDPDGAVRAGYERVIAGRLNDARFFYREDRRRRLEDRIEVLERTRFHVELGSYAGKVQRLQQLVRSLGRLASAPEDVQERAVRAALLSKCDLATQMENEFPELQGVVGGLYAREEGEPEAVWRAVYDQYRPEGLEDDLPRDLEGALLSAADRLDTLVGLLGVGVVPKGSSDPFALRRAALGLVRVLVGRPLRLSFAGAVAAARQAYEGSGVAWKQEGEDLQAQVSRFVEGRLRFLFERSGGGHRYDSIAAVVAAGWDDLADTHQRLLALTATRGEDDFEALAMASRRIRNILAQAGQDGGEAGEVDESRLVEAEERQLQAAAIQATRVVDEALAAGDHAAALATIASLRPHVDRFFDKVLVMAEDRDLRRNRLALLASIAGLYSREADFAEIVVEGGA